MAKWKGIYKIMKLWMYVDTVDRKLLTIFLPLKNQLRQNEIIE